VRSSYCSRSAALMSSSVARTVTLSRPSTTATASHRLWLRVTARELINALCDAELLVVGSRGQLGFPPLRLGATSTKIANYASCPIVIMPPAS